MPDDLARQQDAMIERARRVLPAGGFGNFAADTVIVRGEGGRVWDADGREFVDLLIGSGPMLLGHGHPEVIEAVRAQLPLGQTFFANNVPGIELAEQIVADMACADKVRFVSTGGEADMYAMRLARAHTGRDKIMKFEGGYHGMSDHSLISLAPKTMLNYPVGVPDSAGILDHVRDTTVVAPFNDPEVFVQILDEHEGEIAGLIIEPFQRIIPPVPGWLDLVRAETAKRGIVLIFDEVVTGYRLAYGGAQERYGVVPDLCTLGKIVGGGFPLAAIAGTDAIMAHFDQALVGPEGFTYQVGTLSGNPIAAVAGLKTMEILRRPGSFDRLRENGERMITAARAAFGRAGIQVQVTGVPELFELVFTDRPVRNYRDVLTSDRRREARYNVLMREHGVLKSPGKVYVHIGLADADLERVVAAFEATAETMGRER